MSSKERIYLSLAKMGGKEQEFIQDAFDTNWVVPLGPNVNGFEKDLEEYVGEERHIAALSSGTAAIHVGLRLLGVGRGDEVICQSFTFAASANPIMYLGAEPVFVDSEVDTWNMCPVALEEAIVDRMERTGRKPKAIIPVHLYGMPAKMGEIMAIAEKYGIAVLEDAAEALGSSYKGVKCGALGDIGILSFNGNKMITTSGGGAIVCKKLEGKQKAIFYATQARDDAPHYEHTEYGYNYRLSNISAGIGRGQMLVLDEFVERRRAINTLYTELLKVIEGISILKNPSDDFESNHWLTAILVDETKTGFDREELRLALEAENIESRPLWKPMHLQPVYKDMPFYGTGVSESLFEQGLCLPSGAGLSDEDVERVVQVVRQLAVTR